jgi:integrase
MASIYKRNPKSKNWTIKYKDENGQWKMVTGYTDKEATRTKLREMEREIECRKRGLVDPFERPRQQALSEHVEAFRRHLGSEGNTGEYIDKTISRVDAMIEGCHFGRIEDLTAHDCSDRVIAYLKKRRSGENKVSAATSNHYLTAIKNFCNWATKVGRMPVSSIGNVSKTSTDDDDARQRRAATDDQLAKIVKAAAKGPIVYGLTGEQRMYLYLTAAYSGLRAAELAGLRPFDFKLRSNPPHIFVRASLAKNRTETEQPLPVEFAATLDGWIRRTARPDEKVWPGNWYQRAAEMLQVDLKAAKIPYETEDGFLDFHALRVTFITSLVRGGVHPKIVQTLARHSQIDLTMQLYTRLTSQETVSALSALPKVAPNMHQTSTRESQSVSARVRSKVKQNKPQTPRNKGLTA